MKNGRNIHAFWKRETRMLAGARITDFGAGERNEGRCWAAMRALVAVRCEAMLRRPWLGFEIGCGAEIGRAARHGFGSGIAERDAVLCSAAALGFDAGGAAERARRARAARRPLRGRRTASTNRPRRDRRAERDGRRERLRWPPQNFLQLRDAWCVTAPLLREQLNLRAAAGFSESELRTFLILPTGVAVGPCLAGFGPSADALARRIPSPA